MVACTAGFDRDHCRRKLLEECKPLLASQLLPQNRLLGGVHSVKLENVFRRIDTNSANLLHGRPPLSEIYNDLILARLMPSAPVHTNRRRRSAAFDPPRRKRPPQRARPEVTKRLDFTLKRTNHELRRPCERSGAALSGRNPSRFSVTGLSALQNCGTKTPIRCRQRRGPPAEASASAAFRI